MFDEPLSNLDAQLRVDMRTEIKKLHQRLGATIVYVTHDQIEAMTLATRIAVMRAGELQQLGTPAEIYSRPANTFVAGFMGSPRMNLLTGVLQREWRRTRAGESSRTMRAARASSAAARCPHAVRAYAGKEIIVGLRAGGGQPTTPSRQRHSAHGSRSDSRSDRTDRARHAGGARRSAATK